MSDPAQDPAHDLVSDPQESTHQPRIRLGTFLALMRILAGFRGFSSVRWTAHGFSYRVTVRRELGPALPVVDSDPAALRRAEALTRILDALT